MKPITVGSLFPAVDCATAAQVCGTSGYDKSGNEPAGLPAYTVDGNATTPQLCSALCKSDNKCQSSAIGKETCLLYAAVAENNFSPFKSPPLKHIGPLCGPKGGVQGWDRGNPRPGPYGSDNSHASCTRACEAQPGCVAYALENNGLLRRNTGCYYYTSLVDNFDAKNIREYDIYGQPGLAYVFRELSCPPLDKS